MSEDKPTDLGSASAHAEALALSRRATEQRRRCTELSGENKGKTINKACERLIAQAQANEQKADRLNLVCEALKMREDAARIWNRNAPRDSELADARKAIGAASEELKRVEGVAVIAADAKMKAAIQHSADLNERRKQADEDYERAEKRARAKLSEVKGKKGKDGENHGKKTPGPNPTSQTRSTPGPAAPAKPSAAAPAPATSTSRALNASASVPDNSLSDLLVRTGQLRPQREMQSLNQTPFQQQPQVAPAATTGQQSPAAASARPDNRKSEDAISASDIPNVPVAVPMSTQLPTAATTTATAQTPRDVSGTSVKGLHTEAEVGGRPGGLRTWASGATGLANATGFNAAQSQAGTAQTSMGQPGMVPPFTAAGGPGAAKGTPKIHAAHPAIEYEQGVVPGGTIAQNRPDRDNENKNGRKP
ncbi:MULTISPECIES: hypothetical protein [unclassified Mycobacterium]|uniref:hypothetical protein n=1 Tax=unclassified Mycobacterium TaxID=2642494 RepID=UPI000991CD50|nr:MULTISPECIES: hypothetical protein [unclassified Mycobacterium]